MEAAAASCGPQRRKVVAEGSDGRKNSGARPPATTEPTETQGRTARQRLQHCPAGTERVLSLTALTRVWVVNTVFVTDRGTFFSADPSLPRPDGRLVPGRSSVTI